MREGKLAIVRRMREHVKNAVPYHCTFIHDIPSEVKESVEAQLKEAFERWARSWILPELDALEEKLTPKKAKV